MIELDEILANLKLDRKHSPTKVNTTEAPSQPTSVLQLLGECPFLSNEEKRSAAWAVQWMVKQGTTPKKAIADYVRLRDLGR
jgi:hypothetical protein